jgi:hypothetical protein
MNETLQQALDLLREFVKADDARGCGCSSHDNGGLCPGKLVPDRVKRAKALLEKT